MRGSLRSNSFTASSEFNVSKYCRCYNVDPGRVRRIRSVRWARICSTVCWSCIINLAKSIFFLSSNNDLKYFLIIRVCNFCRCTAAQVNTGGFANALGQQLQKVSQEIGHTTSGRSCICQNVLMPCALHRRPLFPGLPLTCHSLF